MKLTAPAGVLRDTIDTAAQICPTTTALIAYTGVQFEVAGRKLTVRGTDGPTAVAATCTLADGADGSVLVPPKPLLRYLSKLAADAPVTISSPSATSVQVQVGDSAPYKFTALTNPFPTSAALRRDKVTADLSALPAAVAAVRDCAGSLPGGKEKVVQLVSSEAGLRLHATDRYRLAGAALGAASGFGTFDGLLPLRVLDLVASVAPTQVELDPKGRQMVFHADGVVIATRLDQDPYPTVESVLNATPPYAATLDRAAVAAALRRLTAVTTPGCTLRVSISAATATFSVNAAAGSGIETVPMEQEANGEVSFSVNFDYAASAFETHSEPTVRLGWSDPLRPIFITSRTPLPTTLVVMPMADED